MKPEDLEIIELLDLARDIKRKLEGFAAKDHKHPEYALTEHEHDAYAKRAHKHGDYAKKNHQHPEYAPAEHSHPELVNLIANAGGKVIVAAAQGIDPTAQEEDKAQAYILTHTGKKPLHLYDFFSGARFNAANSIIAPGKTFACRIIRHGKEIFVLFDGILTD